MVYPWIYHVYTWIFLASGNQISRPARAAGLIQCAHVCGWSRVFYCTRHPGICARGKGGPQKAHFFFFFSVPLPFAFPAAGLAVAASSSPGPDLSSSSSASPSPSPPPSPARSPSPAPSPPPPPPPAAAAAAARASFLAFESMQKLTHALRLGQGMEHVRGNHVQVLELNCLHGVLRHVIPKGQIHVFAKVW